jgi:alpha-galactosidase
MVDPLTAAVCSLAEVRQMFEEMVEVERDYLPEFLF